MHFLKSLFIILFVFSSLISCENDTPKTKEVLKQKEKTVQNLAPKPQKMEFHIKGMTCEIGCARLIQSKLSKTDGVSFTKVSFKDSLGMVEFDTNKLSKKDINKVVESIADGSLYKISDNKMVTEFKDVN